MKVGDYVRTEISSLNIQRIGKIKEIISEDFVHTDIGSYDKENIIKSSPNIIDLIAIGDILTIRDIFGNISKVEVDENFKLLSGKIVSIVTKEQFEEMEYKI